MAPSIVLLGVAGQTRGRRVTPDCATCEASCTESPPQIDGAIWFNQFTSAPLRGMAIAAVGSMTYPRPSFSFSSALSRRAVSLGLALGLALTATHAMASDPQADAAHADDDREDAPPAETHDDLLLTAGLGAFGDEGNVGGTLGVTGLRQHGVLGYGATFEYGGRVFDYSVVTAAPMVGVFLDSPKWLRLGVAAVGGIHAYNGVGSGLFSSDPGASGTTAFLGARGFVGAEIGGTARFHIGLQLSADDDLSRQSSTYSYEKTGLFSDSSSSATATHTVGTFRYGTMLALGTAFDL
jgi:hypothetical protein